MGVASLVLGIISFLVSVSIFKDFSLICGVISIVLGIIAISKKKGKGMAIAGLILSVIGCFILFGGSSINTNSTGTITSNNNSNASSESTASEEKSSEEQVLHVGDTWTVEGQWKLTIDSVKTTDDRNQFSDIDPAQVVIITYSYENLGYEGSFTDGLYFSLSQNLDASIIDATGEMAVNYPGDTSKYAQETPVGAKCTGAQECIGLMNASDTITMTIKKYDGNGKSQSVKCVLDVE